MIQLLKGTVFGVSGCCSRGALNEVLFAPLWFESVCITFYLFFFNSFPGLIGEIGEIGEIGLV